jgi:hypothetical protein
LLVAALAVRRTADDGVLPPPPRRREALLPEALRDLLRWTYRLMNHNEQVEAEPIDDPREVVGVICLLLRDGRLYGPFESKSRARYWAMANDLKAFSTYDLLPPPSAI